MQHQEFVPPEQLQDAIKCFWYDNRDFSGQPAGFEVVPDGYAEIIFHFGSGCSMVCNGVLQPLPSPFMIGLLNQPAMVYAEGCLQIIGIRCFPWTVFELLGLPPGAGGVRTIQHPVALLQPALSALVNAGKIPEAIDEIKQYLLHTQPGVTVNHTVLKAGVAMQAAGGSIPVSQVATAAHATVRTLERKFKQSSGHSVKDVAALMRFEQVRNQLWLYPDKNLAALAHELGYADQPHLSREFKRYSGTTPAAFARKAKKDKLFAATDFVAFVQA